MPSVPHWVLLFLYLFKFDTALALSSPPTDDPSGCENGTEFFHQSTWHYAPNNTITRNSTFLQQNQIVTTHFRPGGPIFFLQGAESSSQCADWFQFATWAAEFGAMLVKIEHRYFGLSMPFNLTWDNNVHWTKTDLEALTLENVRMDSVKSIDFVKKTIPGAKDSPVIAYGGSYRGTLVTLLRTRLPKIFFGSIASSPPTRFVSDVQSKYARLWGDWVSQVCLQHSVPAPDNIKAGFQAVREKFNPSYFAALKHELGLCTTPDAMSQLHHVLYALAYSYGNIAQFGYKFPPLYHKPLSGFEYLLQETLDMPADADPIKYLQPAADLQAMYTESTCLDWEPDHLVQQTLVSSFIWLWRT